MRGLTRRQALQCLGGGALGAMLSPLPWKLLDDLAIWTQNGAHVPRIPAGNPSTRFSHCTLCPAGCGLQVRCVDGRPVAVTGVPAILVPWAASAEDHQTANVRWLADDGAAVHLPESRLGDLPTEIARLRADDTLRASLSVRARALGTVHRSGALAQLVEDVALA